MTYIPHPAILTHRAVEYLKTLPAGKSIASGPLAEALGTDTGTVITCLQAPKKHGMVKQDKVNGLLRWSMGDGMPMPAPEDSDPPTQIIKPAPSRKSRASKSSAKPTMAPEAMPADFRKPDFNGIDIDKNTPRKSAIPIPKTTPIAEPFRFNYCSTGTITVIKDGQQVEMSKDEYEQLAAFIAILEKGST